MQNTRSAADGARCGFDLVGRRRCEDLAGTGGIEHALSHETSVHRLMTAAATRQHAHLTLHRGICPHHIHGVEEDLAVLHLHDVANRWIAGREPVGDG